MEAVLRFAGSTLIGVLPGIGVGLLLFALELRFPRGNQPAVRARINAIVFSLILAPVMVVAPFLVNGLLPFDRAPPISPETMGAIGASILGLIASDFLYYWLHRAQHSFPTLWRFHAIHHSAEEMGVPAGYHHVVEPFLRAIFIVVPLGFLIGREYVAAVVLLTTVHGYYLHSTTRLNFGKMAWIVCDNRCHRVHHSRDQAQQNRNFGAVTMIWDKLFGTAYFPNAEEWPDVGLDDVAEPRNVGEYLCQPFRSRKREARSAAIQEPA